MRKYWYIFLCFFVFLICSNLYALDNKYISISEKGWKLEKDSDESIGLDMEDFEVDEESFFAPTIGIKIEKNESPTIAKYNQEELDSLKSKLEQKAYKEYYKKFRDSANEGFKKRLPNSTEKQREKILDELLADSGIKEVYYKNIGNSKAHVIEFLIGNIYVRRFVVIKLNYTYIVEVTYPKATDIDSLKPYNDFVKAFKAKDHNPTTANAYIYGGTLWKIISKALGLFIIATVAAIIRKRNG